MARIQEYGSQTEVAGPAVTREAKESDGGGIGDAMDRLGDTIGKVSTQIADRISDAEVSDLTAKMAKRHSDMTEALDTALAQPGAEDDPDFAQKFMTKYDDQMSDLTNNTKSAKASQYMEKANAVMRSQFQISALHGQAHLAGEQAVQNMTTTVDSLSTSVMNNPSGADSAREMAELAIDHLPSNITERQRDAMRADAYSALAMAEVQGWAKLQPKDTLDRLAKGEWDDDLSPTQKSQLEGYAQRELNGKYIEQERQRRIRKEIFSDVEEAEKGRLFQKLYSPAGLETGDVVGNKKLSEGVQEHLMSLIEHDGGKKFKTDPVLFDRLFRQIHTDDGSPGWTDDKNLTAFFGMPDKSNTYGPSLHPGGLDKDSYTFLRQEIIGKNTQEGQEEATLRKDYIMQVVRPKLMQNENPMLGIPDPEGAPHFLAWYSAFQTAYQSARRAGKTPIQLLNPESKDFIGITVPYQPYLRKVDEIYNTSFGNPSASSPPSNAPGSPGGAANPAATAPASAQEPLRPGELEKGNIDLSNRPRFKNADGSISTVRSFSVNFDGKEVLLPTITPDGRSISEKEAIDQFKKDGKHLGVFKDAASANAYAKQLHEDQAATLKKPGESIQDFLKRTGH